MSQTQVKPMVEGGILSAIAVIFALISAYIPVLGEFAALFWPVPIILLGVRHGYKWSILATVAAGIIAALLTRPLHALSVVVGFGLIGIVLGHGFRMNHSPVKTLMQGVAASLISKVILIGIHTAVLGVNPFAAIDGAAVDQAMQQTMNIYRSLGVSEEELAEKAVIARELLKQFLLVMPSMIVLGAVMDTTINFLAVKAILKRMRKTIATPPIPSFPPLKYWNMPRATVYFWALSAAGSYLSEAYPQYQIVYQLAANLQWITILVFLVQGLALGCFLADKYEIPKFIRTVLLVFIFINPLFAQITVFAGIFDLILDYRRLKEPRQF